MAKSFQVCLGLINDGDVRMRLARWTLRTQTIVQGELHGLQRADVAQPAGSRACEEADQQRWKYGVSQMPARAHSQLPTMRKGAQ